jgi:hypothetical protein
MRECIHTSLVRLHRSVKLSFVHWNRRCSSLIAIVSSMVRILGHHCLKEGSDIEFCHFLIRWYACDEGSGIIVLWSSHNRTQLSVREYFEFVFLVQKALVRTRWDARRLPVL